MALRQRISPSQSRIRSELPVSWTNWESTISKEDGRVQIQRTSSSFRRFRSIPLSHAKVVAFGSTCRAGTAPQRDSNLQALIESGTEVITIFGKSWDIHPLEAMKITLDQNLEIIYESIRYLKDRVPEVLFDAEHFFDGFKHNPGYALSTLRTAQEARADWIVLCDTNGGSLPYEIQSIIREVKKEIQVPLGHSCP